MLFSIIGWMGPGMKQVVGFGDQSTGRGTFGANLGCAIVTNGDLLLQRCSPLPKLLRADLFYMELLPGFDCKLPKEFLQCNHLLLMIEFHALF